MLLIKPESDETPKWAEEEDSTICSVISRIERLNKDVFSTFLIPAGNMEEHCMCVATPASRYLGYSG